MEKIAVFLTCQHELIASITNIFTVIGVFSGVIIYWCQKRKDRENNMPVIEFPAQRFFIKLMEKTSSLSTEPYLAPAFFNEENEQVYSIDTIGRNVGLNALQIKKISIIRIEGFKKFSKFTYAHTPTLTIQDHNLIIPLFGKEYIFEKNHKINGSQLTGFVHKEDHFTIEYHPFLLDYIAYNLLLPYHNRGVLEGESLSFTERLKQHPLFTFKIWYNDVNGKKHKRKIQVIGQIEPKEDYYVVQIGYITK